MEKVVAIYDSFEAADRADREFYAKLTPDQRVQMAVDLLDLFEVSTDGAPQRLERIYRIVELTGR
jgi:hypothetical protein